MTNLTNHATSRMRQRAISPRTVDYLLECGRKTYDHKGAVICYFDKASRQHLLDRAGAVEYKRLEHELNAYLVMTVDGTVVTVGHRAKRLNRH